MELSDHFQIQAPQVISETIDGETIIINLESGHYFSLNHSGGQIWNDLQAGFSFGQMAELLRRRYSDAAASSEANLTEFLATLQRAALIRPAASSASAKDLPVTSPDDRPFEKPNLQKYEDMQDLLLLDPIHDVDEAGWPLTKQNAS